MHHVEASTPAGKLRGISENGVTRFLGVPYAASPVGPLRFALPAPVEPWAGVRDATVPGPMAPQTRTPLPEDVNIDVDVLLGPEWTGGDDYLTLNIWRPDDGKTGRPVVVWIHGGGFIAGSKDVIICDGTAFARDGVVLVAINYRLGIEGFLPIPGIPTNLGLRDQIAALAWVRDNIATFGGDPANVTVFGESAGAVSISHLIASPLTKGLFRRAILQSGHGIIRRDIDTARRAVRKLAKRLKITPDEAGFRTVTTKEALKAQDWLHQPSTRIDLRDPNGIDATFGISRFVPVYGDDVLPEPPQAALQNGRSEEVDILIGTNAEETSFFVPPSIRSKLGRLLATYVLSRSFPKAYRMLKVYGMGRKGVTPGQALVDASNDAVFRAPARTFAGLHRGRTHFYEFGWRSPAFGGELGAAHGIEMPFVFDTLVPAAAILGDDPPQKLADEIHRLWIGYAADGNLPWPEFDAETRQVFRLDTATAAYEAPLPAAAFLPAGAA
jgi:para-nitrobenzyl esterase